jgi:hypothetical protein
MPIFDNTARKRLFKLQCFRIVSLVGQLMNKLERGEMLNAAQKFLLDHLWVFRHFDCSESLIRFVPDFVRASTRVGDHESPPA